MISDRLLISNPKRLLCIFIGLLLVLPTIYIPFIVFNVNNVSGSESIQVDNETNGNNYTVIDTYMTWYEAKMYCESQGGHLVTITSDTEQALVHSLIQDLIDGVWIGLTDERIEGAWEWITGEVVSYTNWENGEPIEEDDYAMMHDGSGEWDGQSDDNIEFLPFVCEWSDFQDGQDFPIVGRALLFLFFVGGSLGMVYYNRKKGNS